MVPLTTGASAFEPNDEVDEIRWLAVAAAAELTDYDHDRALIEGLAQARN